MGFSRISNLSLTELFVQQIENMILSGELTIGEQLPSARDLSIRMGVSRPVISAGLIELEKLGFVEIQPRRGAFVSDYRRKGTVETLVAIFELKQKLYQALLNRDLREALRLTKLSIDNAMSDIALYVS